jgi:hypothetical protein
MNLPNLVRRTIVPNLTRCEACNLPEHSHEGQDHPFKLDESISAVPGLESLQSRREADHRHNIAPRRHLYHAQLVR